MASEALGLAVVAATGSLASTGVIAAPNASNVTVARVVRLRRRTENEVNLFCFLVFNNWPRVVLVELA